MAALQYKISHRVLKIFHECAQWMSEIFLTLKQEINITKPLHFCFKNHILLCNHSNSDLFARVTILCFRTTAQLAFH